VQWMPLMPREVVLEEDDLTGVVNFFADLEIEGRAWEIFARLKVLACAVTPVWPTWSDVCVLPAVHSVVSTGLLVRIRCWCRPTTGKRKVRVPPEEGGFADPLLRMTSDSRAGVQNDGGRSAESRGAGRGS